MRRRSRSMSMTLTNASSPTADNLVRHLNVALSQLGDVNQTLDAVFDADERTEGNQLGDLTGHDLADSVGASK